MWANLHGVSKAALVAALALTPAGCSDGSNFFEQFANKKDNASLYHAALEAVNSGNYSAAITICESMTPDFRAQSDPTFICASAYAGRCGYSMFRVADILQSYDPKNDPKKFFRFFMEQYPNSTEDHMEDCAQATAMLRGLGDADQRTDDQNFMLMLMGLTHIGVIMNALADSAKDGAPDVANDKIPDTLFDACDTDDMTDEQASNVGLALWELTRSAEAMNSPLFEELVTVLTDISDQIEVVGAQYNFLSATADPEAYTADQLRAIRTIIKEGDVVGLGYCPNLLMCLCP